MRWKVRSKEHQLELCKLSCRPSYCPDYRFQPEQDCPLWYDVVDPFKRALIEIKYKQEKQND